MPDGRALAPTVAPHAEQRSFARTLVRRRGRVALIWLLLAVLLSPMSLGLEDSLKAVPRIDGSESERVTKILSERFDSPFAESAILVVTGLPDARTPAGAEPLGDIVEGLRSISGVGLVLSYLETRDPYFLGEVGGGSFVVVGLEAQGDVLEQRLPQLRQFTAKQAERLEEEHPDLRLRWTGGAALNLDLRELSFGEAREAELRALPASLAVLLIAFASPAAAAIPVVAGVVVISLVLGLAALAALAWPLSSLLVTATTMIGLALSIDYALLMVSRFRDGLEKGLSTEDAAVFAARRAGHTLLMSGLAVAVGFAVLLWLPINELRSVAVAGLLASLFAVAVAVTLLPGLLAWVSGRLGPELLLRRGGRRWRGHATQRWGRWVAAHPWPVLIVTGIPTLLLALEAPRLSLELPHGDWLPAQAESVEALDELTAMGRGGLVNSLRVVVALPEDAALTEDAGWTAVERLSKSLAADPRIANVRSVSGLPGAAFLGPSLVGQLPGPLRRAFVAGDNRAALLEVIPRATVQAPDLVHMVRELRSSDAAAITGLAGARLYVGGLPAFNADYEETITGSLLGVVSVVVLGTFTALVVGFRSLLIPAKAVLLNLLSVTAAFGAVVLVFQDGNGGWLLGLSQGTDGVFPIVPALVFCAVFGLSMDYEVFMISHIADARRKGLDEDSALAEGIARAGGVITSAAAVMIVVFAAFMLGDFLLIKMLGFALAVTVLIDATLVRMAIGPALFRIAGRWNWWPGGSPGPRGDRR